MSSPGELSASEAFLEMFRRHAAGISVITLRSSGGQAKGFIATSLASLSARPPRATFNMTVTASSWPAVKNTDELLIHTLGASNLELARQFSGDSAERFSGIETLEGPSGLPLLPGVTGWLHGRITERIVLGEAATIVVDILGGSAGSGDQGLVYRNKNFSFCD